VLGALTWTLRWQAFDVGLRDELRERAEALARALAWTGAATAAQACPGSASGRRWDDRA
jgi:hypothetical protein